jgi:hypothetical protein
MIELFNNISSLRRNIGFYIYGRVWKKITLFEIIIKKHIQGFLTNGIKDQVSLLYLHDFCTAKVKLNQIQMMNH